MHAGDTFLIPKSADEIEHLWIVLTEPDSDGMAVCVNVTRRESYSDTTLVLNIGDHPFIRKESVVHYPDASKLDLTRVQKAIDAKPRQYICKPHKPCSNDLLERIRNGLLASPHTPKGLKSFCKSEWEW